MVNINMTIETDDLRRLVLFRVNDATRTYFFVKFPDEVVEVMETTTGFLTQCVCSRNVTMKASRAEQDAMLVEEMTSAIADTERRH